jgi:RNA polymerase subunit RPABC4/transcription elongation factor Spt4
MLFKVKNKYNLLDTKRGAYMDMVYCRVCGKEIHETITLCPHCGGEQGIKPNRNIVLLILVSLGWTIVFWLVALFISGMFVGVINPDNAEVAGQKLGESIGTPLLILSIMASALLTYLGKLPGTYKKSQ